MDQIFRKVLSGAIYLNFLGPAGGPRTRKGAFAFQYNITWLVETEIACSVEEQHFIGTTAGQIHFKVHALSRKILAQNLEYLAALWSDLDEKLASWS